MKLTKLITKYGKEGEIYTDGETYKLSLPLIEKDGILYHKFNIFKKENNKFVFLKTEELKDEDKDFPLSNFKIVGALGINFVRHNNYEEIDEAYFVQAENENSFKELTKKEYDEWRAKQTKFIKNDIVKLDGDESLFVVLYTSTDADGKLVYVLYNGNDFKEVLFLAEEKIKEKVGDFKIGYDFYNDISDVFYR